jgi:hypothetical protein
MKDDLIRQIVAAAQENGIQPARLLALVEVETAGEPLEIDNKTPRLLFERHVFYREVSKRAKSVLPVAVAKGLAIPKWSRSTQYKDEGTSAKRLALIAKARGVHEDCANRSASWGLGQTMGFLAEEHGFHNATEMVQSMVEGGVPAQLANLVRELKNKKLIAPLNAGNWPVVARGYNGSGYRQNQYDTKMAAANLRWERKLATLGDRAKPEVKSVAPPEQKLPNGDVDSVQKRLRALGYVEVGEPDGKWGTKTTAAIAAFQAHEGLKVTGHYDSATEKALWLDTTEPRAPKEDRAKATIEDLRDSGSRTVKNADALETIAKGSAGTIAVTTAANETGVLDKAKEVVEQASEYKSVWDSVTGFVEPVTNFATNHPALLTVGVVIVIAIAVIYYARKIKKARLEDYQTGVHAGSVTE